jgi:hypothetical protein
MLHVTPEPVASAVYTGWRLGSFVHQPRVEPNRTGDVTIFKAMAFPPSKTGLRSFS